jgi:FkbM family methyltransferase
MLNGAIDKGRYEKLKNFGIKINKRLMLLHLLGIANFFKYVSTSKGKLAKLVFKGHTIAIRKGTPDLGVAVSCMNGEFEILRHLLAENYDGIIVDAGGYIGTATIALKDIFPSAKLIVIEPSSENIAVLRQNVANLHNVEVIHGALLGTPETSIRLNNRETGECGFSVVANPNDNQRAPFLEETPAFRLSDLVKEEEKIGLLKLDIEGSEFSLFEHDIETLRNIDVVFAELHDRIIPGCMDKFVEFSRDRILKKSNGEKYLSIKRQ